MSPHRKGAGRPELTPRLAFDSAALCCNPHVSVAGAALMASDRPMLEHSDSARRHRWRYSERM